MLVAHIISSAIFSRWNKHMSCAIHSLFNKCTPHQPDCCARYKMSYRATV